MNIIIWTRFAPPMGLTLQNGFLIFLFKMTFALWSVLMEVDRQLIFAARRLITGANVHRINTLIFQYELAVAISNDDKTGGLTLDAKRYERELRALVHRHNSYSCST
jgi:hypothetical protein